MNENSNDFMISNMMELSLTFDPLRDFIAGEKTKFMNQGFSEEISEKMCSDAWGFLMTALVEDLKKQGGIQ